MGVPLLELIGVTHAFEDRSILRGVDLRVQEGERCRRI